jgi:hypothetical protein
MRKGLGDEDSGQAHGFLTPNLWSTIPSDFVSNSMLSFQVRLQNTFGSMNTEGARRLKMRGRPLVARSLLKAPLYKLLQMYASVSGASAEHVW